MLLPSKSKFKVKGQSCACLHELQNNRKIEKTELVELPKHWWHHLAPCSISRTYSCCSISISRGTIKRVDRRHSMRDPRAHGLVSCESCRNTECGYTTVGTLSSQTLDQPRNGPWRAREFEFVRRGGKSLGHADCGLGLGKFKLRSRTKPFLIGPPAKRPGAVAASQAFA